MKLVYSDLLLATGPHKGGICSILITPKEWLQEDIRIDFATSRVVSSLATIPGTGWLRLQFIPTSYDYEETPKTGRSGPYYEVVTSGTNNTITPQMQQVLNSLTYHQLVCQVKDKRGNIKIVGDKEAGALIQFGHRNKDKQTLDISLRLDSENPVPFFF